MKPGRELDALIAEKVMGLKPIIIPAMRSFPTTIEPGDIFVMEDHELESDHYSTDIAAAWDVVDRLSSMGIYLRLSNVSGVGRWRCSTENRITEFVATPAHAICLAALKAVS